jgi:7,8-dihydroneopterin 2',3'-cyclic phosphate phosphodiesterase
MKLIEELKRLVNLVEDGEVKRVLIDILEKPELTYSNTNPLIKLEDSPAAPRKHHFFTGGLLLHTFSVARIAEIISRVIEEVYGIRVNRDLVIAASILHDIYKYYQYVKDDIFGGYKMREDWYLAHNYAIVGELIMRRAPEKLIRVISEVHGDTPLTTIEGLIVHLADSLDARFGEILQNTMLSRVRDLESTCQLYKVLDKLIIEHGPGKIFSLIFEKPEEFKRMVSKSCLNG